MSLACIQCGVEVGDAKFCAACGALQPEGRQAAEDPLIGTFVAGRYEIIELLSAGGMGKVYRGVQRPLDREVAVKFIHRELQDMEEVVERFMIEARSASALNHPNVISIHDFGQTPAEEGGLLFMVMEFLTGRNLEDVLLEEGPLPFEVIVDVLRQVLAALAEAHAQNLTHRDIKPENIVLTQQRGGDYHVKVIDFGIAKRAGKKLTQVGNVLGTPHYMSPEQGMAQPIDARADVYAVGVVLFELLTGRVPFDGESPHEVMIKHMKEPRPDPREVAPERGISDALADVCLRAMSIDRNERYASAEEFAEDLKRAAAATPGRPPGRAARRQASEEQTPSDPTASPRKAPLPREDGETSTQHRTDTLHSFSRRSIREEDGRPSRPQPEPSVRRSQGPEPKPEPRREGRVEASTSDRRAKDGSRRKDEGPTRPAQTAEKPRPAARPRASSRAGAVRSKGTARSVILIVKARTLANQLAKAFKSNGCRVTVCPLYSGAQALIGPFDLGVFVFEDPATFDAGVVESLLDSGNVQRAVFYGDMDDETRLRVDALGTVVAGSKSVPQLLAEVNGKGQRRTAGR